MGNPATTLAFPTHVKEGAMELGSKACRFFSHITGDSTKKPFFSIREGFEELSEKLDSSSQKTHLRVNG